MVFIVDANATALGTLANSFPGIVMSQELPGSMSGSHEFLLIARASAGMVRSSEGHHEHQNHLC